MKMLLRILLSCLLCLPWLTHAADEKRPNILFIRVDDQSPWEFKFNNPQSPLQSPNIDRLAEMQALLLTEMRRLNDPWRLWNQPADGLTPRPEGPLSGTGKKK